MTGKTASWWNTLPAHFIILMTTALIVSKFISVAIVQFDFERIVMSNVRTSQIVAAEEWLRGGAPPQDSTLVWVTAAPAAEPFIDIVDSQRMSETVRETVIIGWTPVIAPIELEGAPTLALGAERPGLLRLLRVMIVSVEEPDGQWRNVLMGPQLRIWPPPLPMTISLTASLILIVVAAIWAGRKLARPFQQFTNSANRLASGGRHRPMDLYGPPDVRQAQEAFNAMAARVDATLTSQKELLAAIGHDLRTPLTAMRVRAEMLANEEQKASLNRSLDELERLTEAALAAGAGAMTSEALKTVDLAALVEAVCADFEDTGAAVSFKTPQDRVLVQGWPGALQRATRNLIENAIRYGETADVRLEQIDGEWTVTVDDTGPGIPEKELDRVTEPLVRLEQSRSKATGGHGLGLSIVKSLAEAHGGRLLLGNRPEGGLRASLIVPAAS